MELGGSESEGYQGNGLYERRLQDLSVRVRLAEEASNVTDRGTSGLFHYVCHEEVADLKEWLVRLAAPETNSLENGEGEEK